MSRGLGRTQLAVLEALSELGGVASPGEIAKKAGGPSTTESRSIFNALSRLESSGLVRRIRPGLVSVTPTLGRVTLTESTGWSIYNCNWLVVSDHVKPDHIITDPPYDEHTHRSAKASIRNQVNRSAAGRRGGAVPDRYSKLTIDFKPLESYSHVSELIRVSRRWVLCFCSLEQTAHYQSAAGKAWIRAGVYRRKNPTPMFSGDRPGTAAETIAIMHRPGKKEWNDGGRAAYWEFAGESRGRVHPTQKPLGLMLELVRQFTDPGDLVFDPYCGSATTGVACIKLGRRFVGCEIDPKYYALAVERMMAEESGLTVEDVKKGQRSLL